MNRLGALLLAAAGCRAAPVPVPAAEAAALARAVNEANPPLEGFRARGTLTLEGDFFLALIRRRNLDFIAAAAPGRSFVLLRQPFGTILKAGSVEGLMWAIATTPTATIWRRSLLEAEGPTPVVMARDLLVALDLCRPLPERLAFARSEDEVIGRDGENLYAFDAESLRLRRRKLPGVWIEQEGSGPIPDRMVVHGLRLRERITLRVESFEPGPPRPETFEPGPTDDLVEEKVDA